jgi:mono/diheme cytochrome c family protein
MKTTAVQTRRQSSRQGISNPTAPAPPKFCTLDFPRLAQISRGSAIFFAAHKNTLVYKKTHSLRPSAIPIASTKTQITRDLHASKMLTRHFFIPLYRSRNPRGTASVPRTDIFFAHPHCDTLSHSKIAKSINHSLAPFPRPLKTIPSRPVLVRTLLIFISTVTLLASAEPGLAIRFSSLSQQGRGLGEGFSAPSNEQRPSASSAPSALKSEPLPTHSTLPFAAFHFPTPAPFTAEITGFVSVDLRAQHTFTAELTGQATLLINGKEILNTPESTTETNHTSTPIRLSKGPNEILIRYTSPTNANVPARFRLLWSSKNSAVLIPIPEAALTHNPSPELSQSISRRNGAFLFQQYQCGQCHTSENHAQSPFDAPKLDDIGSRLNQDWIAHWLLDPSSERPARMPKLFHGPTAENDARAAAAYLSSLNSPEMIWFGFSQTTREKGLALAAELNCRSCHTLPGESAGTNRISLEHVSRKFRAAAPLVAFLQNPQAHYTGNPMPNFKLTSDEAVLLAAIFPWENPKPASLPDRKLISTGKAIVQKTGCLNCHLLPIPNQFIAPSFAQIAATKSAQGCLAEDTQNSPRFTLTTTERADLLTYLSVNTPATPTISAEFAARATEFLRCNQCHTDNHLPAPLTLGGKLKPEWTAHFIAGEIPEKPRPWLKARMPAFPAYATNLAAGLAAIHGYPAQTPAEPPPVPDLIKTGETLIGGTGGFSCVACHAVGASSVQLVVESPGVNLAWSGDRLLHSFFVRWLMNPLAIDPSTKMPAYFDAEGRSQLTEHFEGDARKQIDAMWAYIRSLSK